MTNAPKKKAGKTTVKAPPSATDATPAPRKAASAKAAPAKPAKPAPPPKQEAVAAPAKPAKRSIATAAARGNQSPPAKTPPAAKAAPKAKAATPRAASKKPAKAAPVVPAPAAPKLRITAANREIALFQIFYREDQRPNLDPDMEPFDNIGNGNPLLEFAVFSRLLKSGQLQDVPLWGALSWKFSQKTGMSGKALREAIRANPGYDVYYTNPSPQTEALYHNLWLQGETSHPDFLATARAYFKAANLPDVKLTELQPSSQFSTANFFVGNQRFWDAYVAFVETTLLLVAKNLPPDIRLKLLSSKADPRGVHFGASYLPFIVERLFPVFMASSGRGLKTYRYGPASPEPENVHLQLLRQMKDVAAARKDKWLAVCWINYRNLYLERLHGPVWMKKYAATINPLTVNFSGAWA